MYVVILSISIMSIVLSIGASIFVFWALNKTIKFKDNLVIQNTSMPKKSIPFIRNPKKRPIYHDEIDLWKKEQKEIDHKGSFL